MISDSERIKMLLDWTGLNANSFAHSIGHDRSTTIRNIQNGIHGISKRVAKDIALKYNNVSTSWLLTGDGDMLNEDIGTRFRFALTDNKQAYPVEEDEEEYITNKNGNTYIEVSDGLYKMRVKLIPVSAHAEYISEHTDSEFIESFDTVDFYVDRIGRGNYVAFQVKGDSMRDGTENGIKDGTIVLARELQRHHWTSFRKAEYGYIIIHKDTLLCKDIVNLNTETGSITCHSRNPSPEYSDFEIKLNDVFQIFKIIKRQM